jgi:hypothetical protein
MLSEEAQKHQRRTCLHVVSYPAIHRSTSTIWVSCAGAQHEVRGKQVGPAHSMDRGHGAAVKRTLEGTLVWFLVADVYHLPRRIFLTASVNRFTEAVMLQYPPRLSRRYFTMPASVNRFTDQGGCWLGCPTSNNRGGQLGRPPLRLFWKRCTKDFV